MKSRVLLAAVVLLTAGCGVFANQIQFGFSGTTPVPRDYDGDGITDLGLYYEPLGMWYIFGSRVGYMEQQWGFAGANPVPFDWNNGRRHLVLLQLHRHVDWAEQRGGGQRDQRADRAGRGKRNSKQGRP